MSLIREETLDPADWEEYEATAHQALQDAIDYLRTVRDRLTWQPLPTTVQARLEEPIPYQPTPLTEVYDQARRDILPYPTGNIHPRFWGWAMGTGTVDGLIADLMASTMNAHLGGFDESAPIIERQVVDWFATMFGYDTQASGLFVSGGTMANITGVAVGRHAKAGYDVRAEGLAHHPQMTIYGSVETHSWITKCCEWLGLGHNAFRPIRVNDAYEIDLDALRTTIKQDRAAGLHPICVIGNAGTVNTGAVDPLDDLADVCIDEDLWFHVDGALGGLAILSEKLRPQLKGIERADSLAFDPHKWLYLQYEIGCVLVKNGELHAQAFQSGAAYLEPHGRGIMPNTLAFAQLGLQLSRGFRALRAWFAVKTHGMHGLSRIIDQNVRHVRYLAERIAADKRLELLAPAPLNVLCFRYVAPQLDQKELNDLNREVLLRVQESGVAIPSSTVLRGVFAIRVAHMNHRTRKADFDLFLDAVLQIGDQLTAS